MQGLEGNHLHTEKDHRQSTRLPLNKDGTSNDEGDSNDNVKKEKV